MSLENLPARENGSNIDETWFNLVKRVLIGIIAPRNTGGTVEADAGRLGSPTYRWNNAFVTSGYLFTGALKSKYSYTSITIPVEPGWMLCDGRVINQTNYDAEQGSGAWVAHGISSSPIAGKHLPDFGGRYIRGVTGDTTNTQDGSATIAPSGSATINIAHNHGGGTLTSSTINNPATPGGSITDVENYVTDHTHDVTLDADATTASTGPLAVEMKIFMRVY